MLALLEAEAQGRAGKTWAGVGRTRISRYGANLSSPLLSPLGLHVFTEESPALSDFFDTIPGPVQWKLRFSGKGRLPIVGWFSPSVIYFINEGLGNSHLQDKNSPSSFTYFPRHVCKVS